MKQKAVVGFFTSEECIDRYGLRDTSVISTRKLFGITAPDISLDINSSLLLENFIAEIDTLPDYDYIGVIHHMFGESKQIWSIHSYPLSGGIDVSSCIKDWNINSACAIVFPVLDTFYESYSSDSDDSTQGSTDFDSDSSGELLADSNDTDTDSDSDLVNLCNKCSRCGHVNT